ncbi:degenerin mec-4-like isoform X2 [Varroa jacobsoni]|uniref:degenerin mec-4-like isoform X2 n=1 Tax=Varroa jacobsoni TaxID=62625 RepID=UPI000BF33866|nr:degenerin mec-4-like isoform X2 [Varroa jacobsoni]
MGERERARQIDIEFTLFLEPKEYLNAKEIPSAQIVFHHPEIIPDPQDNGIPIRSGYAHTFTLRHLVTRRLKHPYWTDCRDYEIVKRDRYIMQMTKSLCDRECAFNASLQMCHCIRRDISLPYEVDWDKQPSGKRRFCDQDITFTRCWVRVLDEVERCIDRNCKRQCWEDQYEVSITQDPWPDQFFFEEEKERFGQLEISNFREARMNLTRVKIIFGTLNKIIYRHRPKYEQIELFSYLGGFIGIWVGVSFMNVLDYLTVALSWCIHKTHDWRKARKDPVQSIPLNTQVTKEVW